MTANVQVPSPRGSRNTKQRAVVLDAVRSLHNHPTSADITPTCPAPPCTAT